MRQFCLPSSARPQHSARRSRGIAALTAAAAVVVSGLAPLAPAQAASATLSYVCSGPNGPYTFKLNADTDAPAKVYVGDPAVSVGMNATVTLDKAYVENRHWAAKRKVSAASGTFAVVRGDTSATTQATLTLANNNSLPALVWDVTEWPISGGGPLFAFASTVPGDHALSVDDFTTSITWVDGLGGLPSTQTYTCAKPAAANRTIDTIRVVSRSRTQLSLGSSTVQQGSAGRATATVSVDGGAVAGQVRFTVGAASVTASVGATGVVTVDLPVVVAGVHDVRAEFLPADPAHYEGSAAGPETLTVKPAAATTTSLTAPAEVMSTDAVTLRATVGTDPASTVVPTGRVDFFVDGSKAGEAQVSGVGVATLVVPGLAAGTRTATARFVPSDANAFLGSEAAPRTIRVTAPAVRTTTSMTVTPDAATTKERVALEATVAALTGATTPQGRVEFLVESAGGAGSQLIEADVVNGTATHLLPLLAAGDYHVVASYLPLDPAAFEASASSSHAFTVTTPPVVGTSTELTLAPSPAQAGEAVTATVDVTAASGSVKPGGSVEVTVNPGSRRVSGVVVDGRATLTLPALTAGTYSAQAQFTPQDASEFSASTSATRSLEVKAPPAIATSTTLSLSPARITTREASTATAVVSPLGAVGKIAFTVAGQTRQVDVVDGQAQLRIADLAIGEHPVTARFVPADPAVYAASPVVSSTLGVVAPPASATTMVLSLSRTTATSVESVDATAVVSSDWGLPKGQVTFTVNGSTVAGTLVNGIVTVTMPPLPQGSYQVNATFVPAVPSEHLGTTASRSLTVTQAPLGATVTTINLARTSVEAGQVVDATIDVVSGAGTPRGEVDVTVAGVKQTVSLVAGSVTLALGPVGTAGAWPVNAQFRPAPGSGFDASNAVPVSLQVVPRTGARASATELSLSRTAIRAGEAASATASVVSVGGTPAGDVVFHLASGATTRQATVPLSQGQARLDLATLQLGTGTWTVTAAFDSGSPETIADSTSAPQTLTVSSASAALTFTSLRLDHTSAARDEQVTVTAHVQSSGTAPVGQVNFLVDGQQKVTAQVEGTSAEAKLPALAVGAYQVKAEFVPANPLTHTGSTSAPVGLAIHDTSAVSLVLSRGRATVGEAVGATATVTTSGAAPDGVVEFAAGGVQHSAPVVDGTAAATFSTLGQGTYSVTARFVPADATALAGSSAAPAELVVSNKPLAVPDPIASSVALTFDAPTSAYGQRVVATATVRPAVSGIVTISAGGHTRDIEVVDGQASVALVPMMPGSYRTVAKFVPRDSVRYLASSTTSQVRVVKDTVRLTFGKRWSAADQRFSGRVRVGPRFQSIPSGQVRIAVLKVVGSKKVQVHSQVLPLDCLGVAGFSTRLAKTKGSYVARISYGGSATLAAATMSKSFRIG